MAETGGGRGVGFDDTMGMEVLRDREADTYILYTNACISCSNRCMAWKRHSHSRPQRSTPRERTRGVGGRKKANCCGVRLHLGLLAFGIGWCSDWLTALEMEA
jgi:hypothetical protein